MFVKIGDFIKFKGFLVEFLENRLSPEKIKKVPRKSPEKWTFLSLSFYNAPSLHTVHAWYQARKHVCAKARLSNPERSTRETDGIAAELLRCGIASEALHRSMPLIREKQRGGGKTRGGGGNIPGHRGVIHADIPAQNFGQGPQNPGKTLLHAFGRGHP